MTEPNPRVEAFFAEAKQWREELSALRAILLGCPVTEEFKWRSPCYTVQGGNVATVWSLKDACTLSFFKGVLLKDPAGILVAPGENSRSVRVARFTSLAEIVDATDTLRRYVAEAVELEKAGRKVELPSDDFELPAELTDRLDAEPALKAAFEALTPGRRRGYALYFSQPKQAATRTARIDRSAARILEGKGLHDR
jgi:uncharacterized protein YdeI (YjbR/CyaY-like superfamily)